ncbi:hypothetical protein Zmor_026767 [Zophobas morio]|uniref:Uncharacterized protein n=1 Tax=Zophobas morio TaxID=2755281 RepID=A0AA38M5T2_9CUCU|nr:hypothetical protein Zmor_026767 [Zophobas morio]
MALDRKLKRMPNFRRRKNHYLIFSFHQSENRYCTLALSLFSEVNSSKVTVLERAGLFDIRATAEVPSLNGPEEFSCELRIPQANYTVRKEAIYYPGG